jgi:D-amino peptidase
MKIYIAADFEGGSCIVGQVGMTLTESKQYEFARRIITGEINAAAEAAFAAGAKEIVAEDAHSSGLNLPYEDLHPEVRIILGGPKRPRFPGLDESFDAVFLIAYHPMAGTERGVLSHSYSSRSIQRMWLNGQEIGEIGFDAACAGVRGVPVVLVSSCKAGCEEAQRTLGDVEVAAVKEGLSRNAAISLHPQKARELIASKARAALGRLGDFKPYIVKPPYEVKREYKLESAAYSAAKAKDAERAGPRTIIRRADSLFDLI